MTDILLVTKLESHQDLLDIPLHLINIQILLQFFLFRHQFFQIIITILKHKVLRNLIILILSIEDIKHLNTLLTTLNLLQDLKLTTHILSCLGCTFHCNSLFGSVVVCFKDVTCGKEELAREEDYRRNHFLESSWAPNLDCRFLCSYFLLF